MKYLPTIKVSRSRGQRPPTTTVPYSDDNHAVGEAMGPGIVTAFEQGQQRHTQLPGPRPPGQGDRITVWTQRRIKTQPSPSPFVKHAPTSTSTIVLYTCLCDTRADAFPSWPTGRRGTQRHSECLLCRLHPGVDCFREPASLAPPRPTACLRAKLGARSWTRGRVIRDGHRQ